MNEKQFFEDLESVWTWHQQCGPLDDLARDRLGEYVDECAKSVGRATTSPQWQELNQRLARFVREHFVSEKAIAKGMGMEDVIAFVGFLRDELRIE